MHPHGTYHSIDVSSKNIINSMINWWKFSRFYQEILLWRLSSTWFKEYYCTFMVHFVEAVGAEVQLLYL